MKRALQLPSADMPAAHPAAADDAAPAHMLLLYSTFYSVKNKRDASSQSSLSSSNCQKRVGDETFMLCSCLLQTCLLLTLLQRSASCFYTFGKSSKK